MTEEIKGSGLSRRSIVKGAAWSVPVLATAVSVPAVSASPQPGEAFDVAVAANCQGNYDINKLMTGLDTTVRSIRVLGVPIGQVLGTLLSPVITALQGALEGALELVGLEKFESRGFDITAAEGTIPQGTQFTLNGGGLINVTLLPDLLGGTGADVLGLVSVNGDSATIQLTQDLAEGSSQHITLQGDAVDLSVGGEVSFALVGDDNPSEAPGAPNSVSQSFIVVETNLGNLGVTNTLLDALDSVDLGGLLSTITTPVRNALNALAVTVQLCPGQSAPAGA